jgi:hypothetical protein
MPIADLAQRLSAREIWLLDMIREHRVFTTHQLTELAFDTATAARHRLHQLHQWRALDRFRPLTDTGSAPWHYTLGSQGALLLAHTTGKTPRQLGYRPSRATELSTSAMLEHTITVNQFFVSLIYTARTHPHTALTRWWPPHLCSWHWGDWLRPDGYGIWHQPAPHHTHNGVIEVDFLVEIDRGTETLDRLLGKITSYTQLQHHRHQRTPVLFQLPSPRRERALHALLDHPPVPVATTTQPLAAADPSGPIWLPAPPHHHDRVPLIELGGL